MIYTINNDVVSIVRDLFSMKDEHIYTMIQDMFSNCKTVLDNKGIKYDSLQNALIPTKSLKHFEIAFWFDTCKISSSNYGHEIMKVILSVMDKNSVYSVLSGDYIDIIEKQNSQKILFDILEEKIVKKNKSDLKLSDQLYIIYFNCINEQQKNAILDKLSSFDWFYGYTDLFDASKLKSYLSKILINKFIKCKSYVILPNPDGIMNEEENVNIHGYPYEDNGFKIISIDEESFDSFLSYKLETCLLDPKDSAYAINSIYPRFEYMKNLSFEILEDKWMYLNRETTKDQKGKGEIMGILDPEIRNLESFKEYISQNLCNNYIYKLEKNEYGDYKFCECIGLKTQNGHYRKTLLSLKYLPDEHKISLITIT